MREGKRDCVPQSVDMNSNARSWGLVAELATGWLAGWASWLVYLIKVE